VGAAQIKFHSAPELIQASVHEDRISPSRVISESGLFEYLSSNPHVLNFDFTSPEKATGFTPKASIIWNPTSNIITRSHRR
jgi:hypothetical protein